MGCGGSKEDVVTGNTTTAARNRLFRRKSSAAVSASRRSSHHSSSTSDDSSVAVKDVAKEPAAEAKAGDEVTSAEKPAVKEDEVKKDVDDGIAAAVTGEAAAVVAEQPKVCEEELPRSTMVDEAKEEEKVEEIKAEETTAPVQREESVGQNTTGSEEAKHYQAMPGNEADATTDTEKNDGEKTAAPAESPAN